MKVQKSAFGCFFHSFSDIEPEVRGTSLRVAAWPFDTGHGHAFCVFSVSSSFPSSLDHFHSGQIVRCQHQGRFLLFLWFLLWFFHKFSYLLSVPEAMNHDEICLTECIIHTTCHPEVCHLCFACTPSGVFVCTGSDLIHCCWDGTLIREWLWHPLEKIAFSVSSSVLFWKGPTKQVTSKGRKCKLKTSNDNNDKKLREISPSSGDPFS